MNALLRRFVEWKGRRRAAQIIVFDGAGEYERARSFLRGSLTGAGLTLAAFLLSAPDAPDERLVSALDQRDESLKEANTRLAQALSVADICLSTAQDLERTLQAYQSLLGSRGLPVPAPAPSERSRPRR